MEADGFNPSKIWVVVTQDVDTGEQNVFERPELSPAALLDHLRSADVVVGHHILGYDNYVLHKLVQGYAEIRGRIRLVDTLVVSRLLDFGRAGGHSLEAFGNRYGVQKEGLDIEKWDVFDPIMIERCKSDCKINALIYKDFLPYLNSPRWKDAIETEHFIGEMCRELHDNGFPFSLDKCEKLCYTISTELKEIDEQLKTAFPAKIKLVREIHPRLTKFGTLNRNDFRWAGHDLSQYNGGSFSLIEFEEFNPGSLKHIVERLNEAGWKPKEKTKGHIEAERNKDKDKLAKYKATGTGWKVSEENLKTLPDDAPEAARKLARRIILASRLSDLEEWKAAYCHGTGSIHGSFMGIGSWTGRMAHQAPNTANIPREDAEFGAEMRALWGCKEGEYLVGVDAEGIQLRVLAHYIEDERFTFSVVSGSKEDGTDPHSLNKKALGAPCKSRNDAKTFIYAWLLGAGIGKVGDILGCSRGEAEEANENFINYYPGLKYVKSKVIPLDAARGYFQGFDGRYVKIRGEDEGSRAHFALAGYLQNGETIIMKRAMQIWYPRLKKEKIRFYIANFVHDEWQTRVQEDYDTAVHVAQVQADAIRQAGEDLKLKCPMAGSIMGGHGKIAVASNWLETH